MTLQDIALRNHDIRERWNHAFVRAFSVSLIRFWSPLYGFDVIKFDEFKR